MKTMVKWVYILAKWLAILSPFVVLLLWLSIQVSTRVIESHIVERNAFIRSMFTEFQNYPTKQKDAYRFDLSIEYSKYNAEIARFQHLDSTFVGIWIPKIVNEKIPYSR